MRQAAIAAVIMFVLAVVTGCDRGEEETSLAPYLYEDGFSISPNPVPAYETVIFFFPFRDQDGDIDDATVIVRLENDMGDVLELAPEEGTFEVSGKTKGAMSFDLKIGSKEESQGMYYVSIVDEAGNRSNEISEYLLVNPPEEEG